MPRSQHSGKSHRLFKIASGQLPTTVNWFDIKILYTYSQYMIEVIYQVSGWGEVRKRVDRFFKL